VPTFIASTCEMISYSVSKSCATARLCGRRQLVSSPTNPRCQGPAVLSHAMQVTPSPNLLLCIVYPVTCVPHPQLHHLRVQPVVSRPSTVVKVPKFVTSVLVEPEVAETEAPTQNTAAQPSQLGNTTPVPAGGDPWEDERWTKYKVGGLCRVFLVYLQHTLG